MKNSPNSVTRKSKFFALSAVSAAVLSVLAPVTVTAQTALEEIIITAEKRETSLQDTPIAVSALTQDSLARKGITDFYNLSNQVPTLTLSNNGGVNLVNMRGTGNEINSLGADAGVGLHLDGVYLAQPAGYGATIYDVERVEVLRGPQGTLFGRNTTGGSINVISQRPTDEFEAFGDFSFGNYDYTRLRGVVNLPLSETVGLRVAASKTDRDGYATALNPAVTNELDDEDSYFFRATLDWQITEDADLSLKILSNERDDSGVFLKTQPSGIPGADTGTGYIAGANIPFAGAVLGIGFGLDPFDPANGYVAPSTGQVVQPYPTDVRSTNSELQGNRNAYETDGLTAIFSWDIDNLTFKSISSYYEVENRFLQDFDDSEVPFFGGTDGRSTTETITQEFQLLSNGWENVEWVAGLFYFDNEAQRRTNIANSIFDALGGTVGFNVGGFVSNGNVDTKSYSVFGQATWSLSDTLNLTVGARWSRDEKDAFFIERIFAPNLGIPGLSRNDIGAQTEESTEPTGRITLDYAASENNLLYATLAHGYRAGAINLLEPFDPSVPPEFVDSLEFGSKNRLMDDRVEINIAAHYTQYTDQQFTQFQETGTQIIVTAAETTAVGIEADFQALVTDNFSIDGAIGWINAEFDDYPTAFGPNHGPLLGQAPTALTNLGGNQVHRTPEWSVALGAQYTQPLDAGDLTFRLDFAYRSEIFYDAFNTETAREPGFTKTNLRVRYETSDDKWMVEAFVDNLEDDDVRSNIIIQNPSSNLAVFNPPRTFGATIGYRY